jgi:hypothetical protein
MPNGLWRLPDGRPLDHHGLQKRFPDFTIDEAGVEHKVNVDVRGLSKLPLVIQARAAA